jgi:MFS family permease
VRRLTWTAYVAMGGIGYLVYAVGFITPYLRHDLAVAPWVAALPNSAMAVGLGLGGAVARRLSARLGPQRATRSWLLVMALGGMLLAMPVSILVTIAGGFAFGASLGGTLVHVNSALGQGARGSLLLTRANLASNLAGVLGPLVLSAAAMSIGWWYGSLVPVPFLLALALVMPGSPARDRPPRPGVAERSLSGRFWLSWAFLTLCIGAEFSYVVWGSQVVAARTGMAEEAATGLASLFVAGMVGGRLAASLVSIGPRRQLLVLRAGTAVTALGALIVWQAQQPEIAVVGLFLGGLGMAPIYPFAAALALAHAPDAPVRASARLTLASGTAIFTAPLVLGVAAGAIGIVGAWSIALAILAVALVLVLRVSAPQVTIEQVEALPT